MFPVQQQQSWVCWIRVLQRSVWKLKVHRDFLSDPNG
jgi:hypothetical protein